MEQTNISRNGSNDEINENLNVFAEEVSKLVGRRIDTGHICEGTGRFYYIQSTEPGAPMILHHYRGSFFIDIHHDDLEAIKNGKVDVKEYIKKANWQIGYFWGGGSMVGGGFYQPFDIIGRSEEVKRYFTILSCRGFHNSCGYMPSKDNCDTCNVEKCPFSKYKEGGSWENELKEYDPRRDFFKSLRAFFEIEYPGYTLRGFSCSKNIPDDQIWVTSNFHIEDEPYSFLATASENTIRALLMHEVEPEDWKEYAKGFKFMHYEFGSDPGTPVTLEKIEQIFDIGDSKIDHYVEELLDDFEEEEERKQNGFFARLFRWFKK